MITCSDIRCMWNAWGPFPIFMPRAVKEADSYERLRPGKVDRGTVDFSRTTTISLCSLRADSLWFSCIRGWSQTAMSTAAVRRRDIRWDKQLLSQHAGPVASSASRHASLEANQRIGKNP